MKAESIETLAQPKDRPFNGFRTAKSAPALALVADVLNQVQAYEKRFNTRTRARKPLDQQAFERQIEAIVSDLVHREVTAPGGGLAISFSKRVLGSSDRYRPKVLSKTLPDVIRIMEKPEMAFVELEIGYSNAFDHTLNRQTAIRAGKRLRTRIAEHELTTADFGLDKTEEIIVLKSSKEDHFDKGAWSQYLDTAQTRALRDDLGRINEWLQEADIDFLPLDGMEKTVDATNRRLRRYFNNGSFEQGGRFFGGFWQNLSKRQRRDGILIDGMYVVTLDYGQMAPRMVYGLAGVQPHFDDAYKAPGLENCREGVKKLFNAMLHSEKPLERYPQETRTLFPRRYGVTEVMTMIQEFHSPIGDYFYRGHGMHLQYQESQVLSALLMKLMNEDIVALPIHDAVIVPAAYEEDAKEVMLQVFKEVTGVEGLVSIDE